MVGVDVAGADNVGGGTVAVWAAVAVGIVVWLETAVRISTVAVVEGTLLLARVGMAAICGEREQPEMSSISIINKPFFLLRNHSILIYAESGSAFLHTLPPPFGFYLYFA